MNINIYVYKDGPFDMITNLTGLGFDALKTKVLVAEKH